MDYNKFIDDAIARGTKDGVVSLDDMQRIVFLVSEAEVMCDIDGIDSFLDRYDPEWTPETAISFERVGAKEIASEFRRLISDAQDRDKILDRLNRLITERTGYDYDSIVNAIKHCVSGN
jgi:hypothetical protein